MTKAKKALGPTPEQMARSTFIEGDVVDRAPGGRQITIGKAYRRRRMLDILHDQGVLSDEQAKALKQYQVWADTADRSLLWDSLAKGLPSSGSGDGPTLAVLNARRMRDDCERAAGQLVDILRAVIVDDMSLSQWAMERHGSIEECEQRKGKRVCRLKPRGKHLLIAQLEIRMVAERVQAEIDA